MINSLVSLWADKLKTPRAILLISPYQLDNIAPPPTNSRLLQLFLRTLRSPRYGSVFLILYLVSHSLCHSQSLPFRGGGLYAPAKPRLEKARGELPGPTPFSPEDDQMSNCDGETTSLEPSNQKAHTDSAENLSCCFFLPTSSQDLFT